MLSEEFLNFLTGNWFGAMFSLGLSIFVIYYVSVKLSIQFDLLGKKMKLSPGIRGATFDAIGGSLPELLTGIVALIVLGNKGLEIGIGTVGGSIIFNILIIPFVSVLFYKKVIVKKISIKEVNRDIIFFVTSIIILFFGLFFNKLFILGLSLVSFYIFYILVMFIDNKRYKIKHKRKLRHSYKKVKGEKVNFIAILVYFSVLYLTTELSIHSILFLSANLGISHFIISLVLLAIITSSPNIFLGIKSAQYGKFASSLGNTVGSNIFDICIGLGVPILIGVGFMGLYPKIDFSGQLPIFGFLVFSTIIYMIVIHIKKLKKIHFIPLLFTYLIFIGYLFM